jgi:hypothetical protein
MRHVCDATVVRAWDESEHLPPIPELSSDQVPSVGPLVTAFPPRCIGRRSATLPLMGQDC